MVGYTTVIGIAAISGFLLSLELRYIYQRLWTRSPRVIIVVALLSCYLFALVWRVIINSSYLQFTSDSMEWEMKSALEFFSQCDALDLSAAVLDRHLFRHQVLRVAAAAARGDAARGDARAGSAAQDAALPAQSPLSLQYPQRDLDPDSRQREPHREPDRHAAVRVSALHARPGPDEEGDAAAGSRGDEPLSHHRETAGSASACGSNSPSRNARSRRSCRACCCSR